MLVLSFLTICSISRTSTSIQSRSESSLQSLIENEIFSSDTIEIIHAQIIDKQPNYVNLTPRETFKLLCYGLDSYFEYKTRVVGSIVKYFTLNENSYENLMFEYFRSILDDFLQNNQCELKNLIVKTLERKKYKNIDKIREMISFSSFITEKSILSKPSRVFESVFKELLDYLQTNARFSFELSDNGLERVLTIKENDQSTHLWFIYREDTDIILNAGSLSVEVCLKYQIIDFRKVYNLVSNLAQYKLAKLIVVIDPELFFINDLYSINTIKYFEHMDKLLRIEGIPEIHLKYYNVEFKFDENFLSLSQI